MQLQPKIRPVLAVVAVGTMIATACDPAPPVPTDPSFHHDGPGHRACTVPPARGYSRMVYDTRSDQVYLFGGFSTLGFAMDILDVWAFDLDRKRWRQIGGLDPLDYDALALDTRTRRVIVYQPFAAAGIETWAFDLRTQTWENLQPEGAQPPARWGTRMVYDAESDRMVLFGGTDLFTEQILDDTWVYDYASNTWTNMEPEQNASPHHFHDMVYHEGRDRVVMFGGFSQVGEAFVTLGDTWVYDFNTNTWTELNPATSPPPRAYTMLAYESRTRKIVAFGGILEEIDWPNEPAMAETWVFDLDRVTWRRKFPGRDPGDRGWHQMVGIGKRGVLLFGGGPSRFEYTDDTFTYRTRSNKWKEVASCRNHDNNEADDDRDDG